MASTNLPDAFDAGDTLSFKCSYTDYSAADGWALGFKFVPKSSTQDVIGFTAVPDGAGFSVNISAATTATWTRGTYRAVAYVTKDDERHVVFCTEINIRPDLAGATSGIDQRTHEERVLEALEAVIENRATKSHTEMEIAGRRIVKLTPRQLREEHQYYKQVVHLQKYGLPKPIRVIFRR